MKKESKSVVRQSTKDKFIQQKEIKENPISFSVNALLGFGS